MDHRSRKFISSIVILFNFASSYKCQDFGGTNFGDAIRQTANGIITQMQTGLSNNFKPFGPLPSLSSFPTPPPNSMEIVIPGSNTTRIIRELIVEPSGNQAADNEIPNLNVIRTTQTPVISSTTISITNSSAAENATDSSSLKESSHQLLAAVSQTSPALSKVTAIPVAFNDSLITLDNTTTTAENLTESLFDLWALRKMSIANGSSWNNASGILSNPFLQNVTVFFSNASSESENSSAGENSTVVLLVKTVSQDPLEKAKNVTVSITATTESRTEGLDSSLPAINGSSAPLLGNSSFSKIFFDRAALSGNTGAGSSVDVSTSSTTALVLPLSSSSATTAASSNFSLEPTNGTGPSLVQSTFSSVHPSAGEANLNGSGGPLPSTVTVSTVPGFNHEQTLSRDQKVFVASSAGALTPNSLSLNIGSSLVTPRTEATTTEIMATAASVLLSEKNATTVHAGVVEEIFQATTAASTAGGVAVLTVGNVTEPVNGTGNLVNSSFVLRAAHLLSETSPPSANQADRGSSTEVPIIVVSSAQSVATTVQPPSETTTIATATRLANDSRPSNEAGLKNSSESAADNKNSSMSSSTLFPTTTTEFVSASSDPATPSDTTTTARPAAQEVASGVSRTANEQASTATTENSASTHHIDLTTPAVLAKLGQSPMESSAGESTSTARTTASFVVSTFTDRNNGTDGTTVVHSGEQNDTFAAVLFDATANLPENTTILLVSDQFSAELSNGTLNSTAHFFTANGTEEQLKASTKSNGSSSFGSSSSSSSFDSSSSPSSFSFSSSSSSVGFDSSGQSFNTTANLGSSTVPTSIVPLVGGGNDALNASGFEALSKNSSIADAADKTNRSSPNFVPLHFFNQLNHLEVLNATIPPEWFLNATAAPVGSSVWDAAKRFVVNLFAFSQDNSTSTLDAVNSTIRATAVNGTSISNSSAVNKRTNVDSNGVAIDLKDVARNGTADRTENGTVSVSLNGTENITMSDGAFSQTNGTADVTTNETAYGKANDTANRTTTGTANDTAIVVMNIATNDTANGTANGTINDAANKTINGTADGKSNSITNIIANEAANETSNGTANGTANDSSLLVLDAQLNATFSTSASNSLTTEPSVTSAFSNSSVNEGNAGLNSLNIDLALSNSSTAEISNGTNRIASNGAVPLHFFNQLNHLEVLNATIPPDWWQNAPTANPATTKLVVFNMFATSLDDGNEALNFTEPHVVSNSSVLGGLLAANASNSTHEHNSTKLTFGDQLIHLEVINSTILAGGLANSTNSSSSTSKWEVSGPFFNSTEASIVAHQEQTTSSLTTKVLATTGTPTTEGSTSTSSSSIPVATTATINSSSNVSEASLHDVTAFRSTPSQPSSTTEPSTPFTSVTFLKDNTVGSSSGTPTSSAASTTLTSTAESSSGTFSITQNQNSTEGPSTVATTVVIGRNLSSTENFRQDENHNMVSPSNLPADVTGATSLAPVSESTGTASVTSTTVVSKVLEVTNQTSFAENISSSVSSTEKSVAATTSGQAANKNFTLENDNLSESVNGTRGGNSSQHVELGNPDLVAESTLKLIHSQTNESSDLHNSSTETSDVHASSTVESSSLQSVSNVSNNFNVTVVTTAIPFVQEQRSTSAVLTSSAATPSSVPISASSTTILAAADEALSNATQTTPSSTKKRTWPRPNPDRLYPVQMKQNATLVAVGLVNPPANASDLELPWTLPNTRAGEEDFLQPKRLPIPTDSVTRLEILSAPTVKTVLKKTVAVSSPSTEATVSSTPTAAVVQQTWTPYTPKDPEDEKKFWSLIPRPLSAQQVAQLKLKIGRESAYPTFDTIPQTSFRCSDVDQPGYYADPEAGCQAFHRCDVNGGQYNFICPKTTLFSQITLVCDYWYNVNCNEQVKHAGYINSRIYQGKTYRFARFRSRNETASPTTTSDPPKTETRSTTTANGNLTTTTTTTVINSTADVLKDRSAEEDLPQIRRFRPTEGPMSVTTDTAVEVVVINSTKAPATVSAVSTGSTGVSVNADRSVSINPSTLSPLSTLSTLSPLSPLSVNATLPTFLANSGNVSLAIEDP